MRAFALLVFIGLLLSTAFGQLSLTVSTPAFETADVHTSGHTTNPNPFMTGGVLRGGRYDLRRATMVDLIIRRRPRLGGSEVQAGLKQIAST